MAIELKPHTDAGTCLVAIAEELAGKLAGHAAEHDRDGSYPFEGIDALKAAGYFAAPVQVELGGLGVDSVHDLVVASSRLARGDASVAIGVNMHLVAVLNMERRRQVAVAAGAERRALAFASSLERIARGGRIARILSEPDRRDRDRAVACSGDVCTGRRGREAAPRRDRSSPGGDVAVCC